MDQSGMRNSTNFISQRLDHNQNGCKGTHRALQRGYNDVNWSVCPSSTTAFCIPHPPAPSLSLHPSTSPFPSLPLPPSPPSMPLSTPLTPYSSLSLPSPSLSLPLPPSPTLSLPLHLSLLLLARPPSTVYRRRVPPARCLIRRVGCLICVPLFPPPRPRSAAPQTPQLSPLIAARYGYQCSTSDSEAVLAVIFM